MKHCSLAEERKTEKKIVEGKIAAESCLRKCPRVLWFFFSRMREKQAEAQCCHSRWKKKNQGAVSRNDVIASRFDIMFTLNYHVFLGYCRDTITKKT